MRNGGLLHHVRHELRLRHLLAHLGPGGAILDYGCGDGAFLHHAAAALPERRFIGYELADRDQVVAVRDNLLLVQGDPAFLLQRLARIYDGQKLLDLPPLGLISLNHVIEHLPPLPILRGLKQRLLPGGILIGQERRACSRAGLQALLTEAGLHVFHVRRTWRRLALAARPGPLDPRRGALDFCAERPVELV